MKQQFKSEHNQVKNFGHAVVIGSSISGLTAARVLTDHFDRVTIIERDKLSLTPEFRRGVPQMRHAHSLPVRGQEALEKLFPGLTGELLAKGAVSINGGSEMAFFIAGDWHEVKHRAATVSMTCSRPLLDTTIYRRLAAHPQVRIIQESEVVGLVVDGHGERVTGVRLQKRRGLIHQNSILAADLVLDASGRHSAAPEWLAGLGFNPPKESTVNAFSGYASRLYRRPAGLNDGWKTMYIRPTPPKGSRGGLIIPIEGDRWYVTLIGMNGDYPPTAEDDFLAFARSLPTSRLYEAIKTAQPLNKACGYRHTANRVRHYDNLPRYLEGFVVAGDAIYTLNPVYAQGMTAALLGSQALAGSLMEQNPGTLMGLAQTFQSRLTQNVASAWQMAIREDRRWPSTEVAEQTEIVLPGRSPVLASMAMA